MYKKYHVSECCHPQVFYCLRDTLKKMFKTSIAAAATPLLVSGAAFAGPYVNLEATGSYPDGTYTSGGLER